MTTRKKKQDSAAQTSSEPSLIKTPSPLVFISHDTRDADFAEAFANLLTDASGGMLKSFRSSDRKGTEGIEFGAEWYAAIMSKLADATDVVALLTTNSVERPWILYEAGVAKGKLDTTVLGLAINVSLEKANTGPFAQFQNCADDEDSLTKLILQLIRRNPEASPREEAVRRQVQAFRDSIKALAEKRAKTPVPVPKIDEDGVGKMFEEVKILVRGLHDTIDFPHAKRPYPKSLIHPKMLERFLHMEKPYRDGRNSPIPLLVALGFLRNSLPWIYDMGLQFYDAFVQGDEERTIRIKHDIIGALRMFRNTPLEMEFFRSVRDDDAHTYLRLIFECIDELFPRSLKEQALNRNGEEARP